MDIAPVTSSPEDPLVQLAQQYWPAVPGAASEPSSTSNATSKGGRKKATKTEDNGENGANSDGPASSLAIDNDLVNSIYFGELKPQRNRISKDRLTVLEFTGFLERYLWPRFEANSATFAQVMLIILLVNEKNRQGIDCWTVFERRETEFRRLLACVVSLNHTYSMNAIEAEEFTRFLVVVFQSLENPVLCPIALRLVSIGVWRGVHDGQVELQLRKYEQLRRLWSKALKTEPRASLFSRSVADNLYEAVRSSDNGRDKKRSKTKKNITKDKNTFAALLKGEDPGNMQECIALRDGEASSAEKAKKGKTDIPENSKGLSQFFKEYESVFLPSILITLIRTAEETSPEENDSDKRDSVKKYLERSLELIIDLLSQLPTRRFFKLLVSACNTTVRLRKSAWIGTESGRLFGQLVDILDFFVGFEVDEHTGQPLSREDVISIQYEKLQLLQRIAYTFYQDKLKEFALSAVGNIAKPEAMKEYLSKLEEDELKDVARRLQLIPTEQELSRNDKARTGKKAKFHEELHLVLPCYYSHQTLLEIISEHHRIRHSALEEVNKLPLYPNERLLWDRYLVPFGKYYGDSVLALPKLNLQFLTIDDYLLRSFNLYRLEAAYEIREDIIDSVKRLGPKRTIDYAADGTPEIVTRFAGWSRMALQLQDFAITSVTQPKVGQEAPASVLGEIKYDLSNHAEWIRKEWDELSEHDVCFLLTIRAPSENVGGGTERSTEDANAVGEKRIRGQQNNGPVGSEEGGVSFPFKYGVAYVRGCEIVRHYDEQRNLLNDPAAALAKGIQGTIPPKGTKRTLQVKLDPNQYHMDILQSQNKSAEVDIASTGLVGMSENRKLDDLADSWVGQEEGEDVYQTFNILIRRPAKENNFKSILETIRQVMNMASVGKAIPSWLYDVFLGYGDPAAASYKRLQSHLDDIDFKDTIVSQGHAERSLRVISQESLPAVSPSLWNEVCRFKRENPTVSLPFEFVRTLQFRKSESTDTLYKVTFESLPVSLTAEDMKNHISNEDNSQIEIEQAVISPYSAAKYGPYPEDKPRFNDVPFTNVQMEAIRSGVNPGLTMVVGPPGTGKTDVAVQTISNIYHNFPNQRTLIVTHSNHALNDIFEKLVRKDIHERHMLRLGMGERELQLSTSKDFSKWGRVNDTLKRRIELLQEVQRLGKCMQINADVGSTCETAENFYREHVIAAYEIFQSNIVHLRKQDSTDEEKIEEVLKLFPFQSFFEGVPGGLRTYLAQSSFEESVRAAQAAFQHIDQVFAELKDYRAFELLRTHRLRSDYLLTNQAKIVAMTCTHAALNRQQLIDLNFKYDNIVMEEAAQILEVETFIPMLLQQIDNAEGCRLKRVVLIGDHHQLPPVVKNMAFQKYGRLDQSLFSRFIRLGTPFVQLNQQARARASIAELYRWRYSNLGDMKNVLEDERYKTANAGLVFEYQLVNVPDFNGQGESQPSPHFYQNLGEAEYAVALYQYMRLLGYPSEEITILTTYNGQKSLIRDVASTRCKPYPWFGMPSNISTVDKYQGQQNDYIILSLVRTKSVGHIRDVRRLVVALSRARLGLYVFCRKELFSKCVELAPAFQLLNQRPSILALVPGEKYLTSNRSVSEKVSDDSIKYISGMKEMGEYVYNKTQELVKQIGIPTNEGTS